MATTDPGTRPSFAREVRSAVSTRAAALVIGVLVLQLAFIASYVGAFHSPKPKNIALAVVAPEQVRGQLLGKLDKLPGDPLDPRAAADEAKAVRQIRERDIDAALIVDPRGSTDRLLVASGGGASLSQAVEQVVTAAEKSQRRTVKTQDIAPVAKGDARGLSAFYLVVGWCVGGYLCAAILAISAGARPANPRRAVIRLGTLALYSIASGIGGAVIMGPILEALPGSILGLWGLGAMVVFAVGATTLAFQGLAGVVGIGLAIAVVVVLGNPSAGGAYPYPLLPGFWRAIGPALPPGAGTWTARSIAYFRGNAVTGPLLVLSAWAVAGSVITLLFAAFKKPSDGAISATPPR
ncbi:DUF3533 domain-containing protein [Streptomyces sp. NPDC057654]|uniref:DUF3533 domain-containing protein n=1 Tax=Streptomyces sp. NPDC057654 TaxID=3346196 RepID=UPI003677A4E6